MKPKIITLFAQKGGVGKSSIACHLAGIASQKNAAILLDLDEQGSTAQWGSRSDLPFPVHSVKGSSLKKIQQEIEYLAKKHKAEYVIIDSPPSFEDRSLISAMLSQVVLTPALPSAFDLWSVKGTIDVIESARKERGGKYPVHILVPNKTDRRTSLGKELPEALRNFKIAVSPCIRQRVAISDAILEGETIAQRKGTASYKEFIELWKYINKELNK